jgi:hypothetical protein
MIEIALSEWHGDLELGNRIERFLQRWRGPWKLEMMDVRSGIGMAY